MTEPTEVVETIDEEALELERKRKEKEKQDAIKAQQEKERKEREAEEARKRKEAADRFKNIGKGTGKGNTNTAGNQGDDLGDPDSKNLEGAAKGNGQVGGGLGDRGIGSRPDIANNTSNTGTVVINLCVDSNGNVIPSSVRFTSAGSTTQNSTLKNIAISNAKRWKFSPSSKAEECGSITYKFEN